jgi:hypothetical protein
MELQKRKLNSFVFERQKANNKNIIFRRTFALGAAFLAATAMGGTV